MKTHFTTYDLESIVPDRFGSQESRQQKNISRIRGADPMLPPGTNRCLCAACGEFFGGVRAFDIHRIGVHHDHSCLTRGGMADKGLRLSANGYWIREYTGKRKNRIRAQHLRLVPGGES